MELVKINETYRVTDTTDTLSANGQVTKEQSGMININLSINTKDIEGEKYLGHYSYSNSSENNVSVNYNCDKDIEDAFEEYANNLTDQILAQL